MAVLKLLLLSLAVLCATAFHESAKEAPPAEEEVPPALEEEQTLKKCKGDSVAFPWKTNTSADEQVASVQWDYKNASTSQIVAVLSNGQFKPGRSYKSRVVQEPEEGLVLRDLTSSDSGQYNMYVIGYNSGLAYSRRSSKTLKVSDGFLKLSTLSKDNLRLRQQPEAVWDSGLNQWTVRLTCGHFAAASRPPFDVTWETPRSTTLNSTTYADGQFILALTPPFSEGAYGCRVPAQLVYQACKFGDKKPPTEIVARLTLNVDTARIALMEARLRTEVAELRKDNAALTSRLQDLQGTMQETTKALSDRLNSGLSKVTNDLKETTDRAVAFNVKIPSPIDHYIKSGQMLPLHDVTVNVGRAYDKNTCKFTAPMSGLYCFIMRSTTTGKSKEGALGLIVDGSMVAINYFYSDDTWTGGSMHSVLSLTKGQRVWLISRRNSYLGGGPRTVFSGFLLHAY